MIRFAALLLLASSVNAQPARLELHVAQTPLDETRRVVTVQVETIVPLADPERITLQGGAIGDLESWTATGMACEPVQQAGFVCTVPPMAAGARATLTLTVVPAADYFDPNSTWHLKWQERGQRPETKERSVRLWRFTHELAVTNTDDGGPGSLRQALLDANVLCTEFSRNVCRIRFDLGEYATIRPSSALPRITAYRLEIDGESRVAIDGSATVGANGLESDGSLLILRGLKVHSFPQVGVELVRSAGSIERCEIVHNASRGISAVNAGWVDVHDSVISGNLRSGIWLDGVVIANITNNSIGVAPDGVTPMPNLASGIFAMRIGVRTVIQDNAIAHNAHFGFGLLPTDRDTDIGRNSFFANRGGQIDVGLDGPSRFPVVEFGFGPANGPLLTSATYDAATNTTTIRGLVEGVERFHYFRWYEVQFFASPEPGDARQFLGALVLKEPVFTFTVRGDYRGRYIAANSIRVTQLDSESGERAASELGPPLLVP